MISDEILNKEENLQQAFLETQEYKLKLRKRLNCLKLEIKSVTKEINKSRLLLLKINMRIKEQEMQYGPNTKF